VKALRTVATGGVEKRVFGHRAPHRPTHQSTGRDPLRCPHCQGEMALWRMWHPKYGVIYDEAKRIRRGDYERRRERAPTDLDGQVARRALA